MKSAVSRAPISPARARNCALLNQCATPGLGSLFARRFVVGACQLVVFLAGFGLFLAWFVDEMRQYYGMMFSDQEIHMHPGWAFAGIGLVGLAWLWALVTSIGLLREAKRNVRAGNVFATPPVLPRT
jgi:hypothetical protein